MIKNEIKLLKKPRLKKPVLIEGLPGFGLVGRLAAEHLVKQLKAVKFAEFYSPGFPPQVKILPDGTVSMHKAEFYYSKQKKKDLIILLGDDQAATIEWQYSVCGDIIEFARKNNTSMIITLGGYGVRGIPKKPRVFGAATDKSLIKTFSKHGALFGKVGGDIIGAAGLLIGIGALRGIPGVCLMGETHGSYVDPKAASSVLKVLTSYLGLKISFKELDEKAKEIEKMIKRIEEVQKTQQATIPKPPSHEPLTYIR